MTDEIRGVATDVAALVGTARDGPTLEPKRLTSFRDYETTFGAPADGWMGESARAFFGDGGVALWVVRAPGPAAPQLTRAIAILESLEEPALAACPEALAAGDDDATAEVVARLVSVCDGTRKFAVVDAPELDTAQALRAWRERLDSSRAAVVAPFVRTAAAPAGLPPSGAAMGSLAEAARSRGWPTGWEAARPLLAVTGLKREYTSGERALLVDAGISLIRWLPARGVVVWGSRTASSDPEWRHVRVRRLADFLESSIDRGLGWVVSEPNDEGTWRRVRLAVIAFLDQLWRQGALNGTTPEKAYFVRVGRDTTTQPDAGVLDVLVGAALMRASEFVVIRVQKTGVGTTP